MRIETKPWAGAALAVLLYIFVLVLALVSAGCNHYPEPKFPRTPAQMIDTAVVVQTECGIGSGVLVDARRVYTAYHVVNCGTFQKARLATSVKVHLQNGAVYVAAFDAVDASRDLARLRLPSAVEHVRPLIVARATQGQVVCAVTAWPDLEAHCGIVGSKTRPRVEGDVHIRGANLWLGNSGSGVYNTDGALVGIVVRMHFCNPGDAALWELLDIRPDKTCGGRASTIEGPVKL